MSEHMSRIKFIGNNLGLCSQLNATEHLWWWIDICSVDGLVPSGNKWKPESLLTQIYDDSDHMAPLGHSELNILLLGLPNHDYVIKWKHFPRNWPLVREIHRSPVNFPHKGQWHGALMFSLIYAWINDWVNNREAGDLRRQHGHYDVIVMYWQC